MTRDKQHPRGGGRTAGGGGARLPARHTEAADISLRNGAPPLRGKAGQALTTPNAFKDETELSETIIRLSSCLESK